jgi:hypothetical protein
VLKVSESGESVESGGSEKFGIAQSVKSPIPAGSVFAYGEPIAMQASSSGGSMKK